MIILASRLPFLLWALSLSSSVLTSAETIVIPWRIPSSGEMLNDVQATVGDTLNFQWPAGTHNVNIHPSMSCDETDSVFIGSANPTRYTLTKDDVGTLFFACQIGNHCELGQFVTVEVSNDETPDADLCELTFADGRVIQVEPGEVTGPDPVCGEDFLCYCSPGSPNNEWCPYCVLEQVDGSVLCLVDDQTETFVGISGTEQTCTCSVPDDASGPPIKACIGEGLTQPPLPDTEDEYCVVTDPSTGVSVFYENGQSFDRWMDVPCGHGLEASCTCNTALPTKIECPYCVIDQEYDVQICALKNERVTFEDIETGVYQSCKCIIDDPLTGGSLVECQEEVRPTPAPSPHNSGPTPVPPTAGEPGGCITILDSFNEIFTSEGDSFGDLVEGVCGSSFDFPATCNTAFSNGIEYPYCQFSAREGIVCAEDGQTLTYTALDGEVLSCDCSYTQASGPRSTCRGAPTAPTPTFGGTPTFPAPPIRPPTSPTPAPAQIRPTSGSTSIKPRMFEATIYGVSIAVMVRFWNLL